MYKKKYWLDFVYFLMTSCTKEESGMKRQKMTMAENGVFVARCLLFMSTCILLTTCAATVQPPHALYVEITKYTFREKGKGVSRSATGHTLGEAVLSPEQQARAAEYVPSPCLVNTLETKVRLILPWKITDSSIPRKDKTDWINIDRENSPVVGIGGRFAWQKWVTSEFIDKWWENAFLPPFRTEVRGIEVVLGGMTNLYLEATAQTAYSCGRELKLPGPDRKLVRHW